MSRERSGLLDAVVTHVHDHGRVVSALVPRGHVRLGHRAPLVDRERRRLTGAAANEDPVRALAEHVREHPRDRAEVHRPLRIHGREDGGHEAGDRAARSRGIGSHGR